MISKQDAYNKINAAISGFSLSCERVKVQEALYRVIAEEQVSRLDLPPFNKSAMDGYAILADDFSESYQLIEVVPAGDLPRKSLSPGKTIQVMTGSPVPTGAGRVVPVEKVCVDGDRIIINGQDSRQHICMQGEDVKQGSVIVPAGQTLTPLVIANLVACGITEIPVYKRPRFAIFSTGEELATSYEELTPGKIMDSNGPLLQALCAKNGYEIVHYGRLKDDLDSTCSELSMALKSADIVLFSGGVSMGEFDYVAKAFQKIGLTTHFNRVAIKPGKPTTFATSSDKIVFGLPGNPVAVYLTFHLFVTHVVKLLTSKNADKKRIELPLEREFLRKNSAREAFIPCVLNPDGSVRPVDYNGSAHMLALLDADGFFVVPRDIAQLDAGTPVEYYGI